MARFYGPVGYGVSTETASGSGVYKDVITEVNYYGDILRDTVNVQEGEGLNDNISVGNSISIIADEYANNHFHEIKYVSWAGALWKVSQVEVKSPRLILTLGGVYNGPTP